MALKMSHGKRGETTPRGSAERSVGHLSQSDLFLRNEWTIGIISLLHTHLRKKSWKHTAQSDRTKKKTNSRIVVLFGKNCNLSLLSRGFWGHQISSTIQSQSLAISALTESNRQKSRRKKGFGLRNRNSKSQIASDFPSHPYIGMQSLGSR